MVVGVGPPLNLTSVFLRLTLYRHFCARPWLPYISNTSFLSYRNCASTFIQIDNDLSGRTIPQQQQKMEGYSKSSCKYSFR